MLGAGGIIAPAIVRDLAESEEVDRLLLLDLDAERARATGQAHAPDAEVKAVDPHGGLGYLLTAVDVLVNSASYRVNLDAMRACLEAGCHYIDLGGLYHLTTRQLELDHDFATVGKLALLGMGSSPGKTNVMGVRATEELGATPELMDVYAAGRDLDPPDGPSYPYAPRTLVDELTEPPMALRGGEPVALEPMQDGGSYPFPEPIGEGASIYTLHSEVRTFGDSFGCADCSFRLSLAPAVLERVRALVGADDDAIAAAAAEAVPSSARTVSVHVVTARANGRRGHRDRQDRGHGGLGHRRRASCPRRRRPRPPCGCWRAGRRRRGRHAARALRPPGGPVPRARAPQLHIRRQNRGGHVKVGVPTEIKTDEYRVSLTPAGARELADHGHEVIVQAGAGEGSAIADADYTGAGRADRARTPSGVRRGRDDPGREGAAAGGGGPAGAPATCCSPTCTWRPTPS